MKRRITISILLVGILIISSFGFAFGADAYTVKQGDVLWKIAKQHGLTYQELSKFNQLKNPDLIYSGQVLQIPENPKASDPGRSQYDTEQPSAGTENPSDNTGIPSVPVASETNAADSILKNGAIYTIDGADTVAEAIAMKGNKIIYVGSSAGAAAYQGSSTKVIDLKGKTVLPGFIDAHAHAPGTKLTELFDIYLYESITKEQTLADIKSFIDANPDLKEYWGTGYTVGMAGDAKGPKKEWLDAVCADKPIILTSNDGHNMWLNSKALEMNGITKKTPNPAGGLIQKDPVTGELWGSITDASSLITMTQTYTVQQEKEALAAFVDTMNGWGYTSIMSIAPTMVDLERYRELEQSGDLTFRVNLAGQISPSEPFEPQLKSLIDLRSRLDSDLIDVTTAKVFADGVVEGMTAYLLEPYDPAAGLAPDYRAEFYWDPDLLDQYFDKIMKAGFQIHVHSIGDASTRLVLDSMEYAQNANPTIDNRNVITHLQVVDDADKPRFGKLEIIAALQPYWHLKEPEWWSYVDKIALGEDRAYQEYPVKSLLENGALLTASGDHPVSPINNPFWAIEADVTRNLNNADYYGVEDITNMDDPTWLLNKEERVSVKDMVKAYTINGAYQLFRDKTVGSLEVGKYADMIIIDQNIFQVNPLDIDKTQVLTTIFNGNVVFGDYQY